MINETITATGIATTQTVGTIPNIIPILPYILIIGIIFIPRYVKSAQIFIVKGYMRKLKKKTGNNILVMSHVQSGLFGDMISAEDLMKIEKQVRKFKGKDFDFIINTFGGDLFASIKIAKFLKAYKGKVRVFVPKYAMSGGTMIALGADEIIMDKQASLGPIDPQLGNLFKYYSSRAWNEIIKKKGKKADDDSYAMALIGNQVTKIAREVANDLVDIKNKKKKRKTVKALVEGMIAHCYQFNYKQLKKLGLKVNIDTMISHHKIIEGMKKGGIAGV